jgi:long-chain acyl-CoA synthetase
MQKGILTVGEFLAQICEKFPNQTVLYDFQRGFRVSYECWGKDQSSLAKELRQRGFIPGDFAMIRFGNNYGFLLAYAGVVRAEGVVAPVVTRQTPNEFIRLLNIVKPKWLLTDLEGWEELEQVLRESSVQQVGIFDGSIWKWIKLTPKTISRSPDSTLAHLRFTSGSQGEPKVVMLTHENMLYRIGNFAHYALPRDVFYCAIPFVFRPDRLIQAFSVGGEIVVNDSVHPGQIVRCWKEAGVTFAWLVPTVIGLLTELKPEEIPGGLALRGVNTGGAYLYQHWEERFEELFNVPVYQQYGLSEGCVAFENPPNKRIGSVGKPTPTVEVRICNPNTGEALRHGEIGELRYRGKNVMRGYLDRPDLTATTLREGWLRTGDLARFDEDGYLFIEGRIKDLIHSGGLKFSPREVEDVLLQFPGIREVSIVSVSHTVKGEVAKAFIVADILIKPSKLREFCKERLADYKIPRKWEQVESLPKLESGKIARRSVRQS